MRSYVEPQASVGELRTVVVDCQILTPGQYQGRIVDRQPADRTHSFLTLTTDKGVHIEAVEDDLINGLTPGATVTVTISKVPGLALLSHAGTFAVRGPAGERLTEYGPIKDAVDYIQGSSTPMERIGITEIKPL